MAENNESETCQPADVEKQKRDAAILEELTELAKMMEREKQLERELEQLNERKKKNPPPPPEQRHNRSDEFVPSGPPFVDKTGKPGH